MSAAPDWWRRERSARDVALEYGFLDTGLVSVLGDATTGAVASGAVNVATGGSVVVAGQTVDASTLANAANLDPATVVAQGKAAGVQVEAQLGGAVKAAWDAQTTPAANNARIATGSIAAISLATKGFDPNNPDDDIKVVLAIAGAVSLIVPIGTVLGGALTLLVGIGVALSKILQDVGLIGPFGCFTSGNWTPANVANVVAGAGESDKGKGDGMPQMPPGSFAALVMPALLKNQADAANCVKTNYSNLQVLAAMAHMWNANASGPPMTVYVPAVVATGTHTLFAIPQQSRFAFAPTDVLKAQQGAQFTQDPNGQFFPAPGLQMNLNQPILSPLDQPACILQLTGSTLLGATPATDAGAAPAVAGASAGASTSSIPTPVKVVGVAAVAAGGAWLVLGRPMSMAALRAAWRALF